ncbi:uncharacterized protein LOC107994723 isoform X2 [Apis cerana]|uniref:uncharacterized protein LOC107994723 isoform X2 n=1 Tax=Apis cerana TaxID=7461 RepID=UPI002B22762A|nr:uncharacterized protein LOC107994723 isoform X2 [Apis cerana]
MQRKDIKSYIVNRLKGIYLFRAAVRLVLEYIEWLVEEPVIEEVSDDIAINIRRAEQKRLEKKMLTLQDRSYLLTRPENRAKEDRRYVYELFKKFRVFVKYPERLREVLAGVCYYQYLRAGRVIVRQGHKPRNQYFIINGEVSVTKTIIDRWTGETKEIDMGILTSGDVFGEIAMLCNIPRSATVVTLTSVDLILIPQNEFDDLVRPFLQKEWDLLQDALINFNYFKSWDEKTIRECCILSKIRDYQIDEVLLGDGKGMVNYVHFLLEGECSLIEHMIVREKHSVYGTHYELYDPEKAKSLSWSKNSKIIEKIDELEYEYQKTKENDMEVDEDFVDYAQLLLSSKPTDRRTDLERTSIITTTLLDVINQWHKITDVAEMLMREPSSISQQRYPIDVRTIFMQICTFSRGACFGLGENMVNRRIVANTPVRCCLIPRYWLKIHNRANIWERVKQFMDSKFPTKEQLFQNFVTNRRWLEYKKILVDDIGERTGRRIRNNVTIHDVPYAIRIVSDIGVEI